MMHPAFFLQFLEQALDLTPGTGGGGGLPKIRGNFLDFEGKLCYLVSIGSIDHPKPDHREYGPGKRRRKPLFNRNG
jgi:hypothetical protein